MHALIDGDIWLDGNGYQKHANDNYVHRTIVEKALGRKLKKTEGVHHVDGNPANNEPKNLVVFPNQKYHFLLHARQRIVDRGGNPNIHKFCSYHKELHDRTEFSTRPTSYDGLHNMCRSATNEYRRVNGYTLRRNRKPEGGK